MVQMDKGFCLQVLRTWVRFPESTQGKELTLASCTQTIHIQSWLVLKSNLAVVMLTSPDVSGFKRVIYSFIYLLYVLYLCDCVGISTL